jgi:hypothetical protein
MKEINRIKNLNLKISSYSEKVSYLNIAASSALYPL